VLVEAHRRPRPPYDAGAEAATLGATAMIDVSDGLLADAGHIARASDVAIDLDTTALDIPGPLRDVGAALGVDPLEYVLTGGEDHSLLATFPPNTSLPSTWRLVGTVSNGAGVTVDGAQYAGVTGHQHFG
jgi:thiamine-monophosphate kinase